MPPPPPPAHTSKRPAAENDEKKPAAKRRQTVFNVTQSGEVTTGPASSSSSSRQQQPRRHTAVAAVLGGEMHETLKRGEADRRGDIDVEVLLKGAEKLCGVYDLPGARERIASLRAKFRNGRDTAAYYEGKVAEQAEQLASLSRNWMDDEEDDGEGEEEVEGGILTVEDLKREEEEAREMEGKKRELQARLRTMEKDLGGLMNM